ncbi:MAG: Sec-independent protein translocase protein TatB, partial [Halothiobacillaceae bacterium]
MFDLSFWEITVIAVVAVIVVGPERLPGLAYKAGQWVTKVRRFVANAKAEMESEFNTAELRKLLSAQEEEMQRLRRLVE